MTRPAGIALVLFVAGCAGGGPPGPAPLDARTEHCHQCRMTVSDPATAAQIVAPGEEPIFFDDLGCASQWLGRGPLARDGVVYVADHRTREWVRAADAVFTRATGVQTPMGSGLIAHASAGSRDRDPAARGGDAVTAREILGAPQAGSARPPS